MPSVATGDAAQLKALDGDHVRASRDERETLSSFYVLTDAG